MTMNGVVQKSFILFALAVATAAVSWSQVDGHSNAAAWILPSLVIAFAANITLFFKQRWAPILAPVFALAEGVVLGAISRGYEDQYHGIVAGALFATGVTFAIVLLSYTSGLIRVTDRMMRTISVAMISVFLFYVGSLILNLAHVATPWMTDNSPIGYLINIVVIVIAAAMLLVDFEFINRGVASGAPKYMEWYSGFALLVQVVWLYVEFLRLLGRMRQ